MAIQKLTITQHDGSEIIVVPNLFDTFGFEKMLKANPRLGTVQENSLKLQAFRGWSAAKRTGQTEQTWEQFTEGPEAALSVLQTDETDDELEVAGLGLDTPLTQ